MTHSGSPKRLIFGPDSVEITNISTGNIIEKGAANHASKAYEFSHFMPFSEPVHPEPLEEISTQMGLLTQIQIPCHHVLANEIYLNLKYHIGLKQFFNINLGIGIIKKLLFLYFRHISLCFYSNFDRESSSNATLNSASNDYPLGIFFMDPTTPKQEIPKKT